MIASVTTLLANLEANGDLNVLPLSGGLEATALTSKTTKSQARKARSRAAQPRKGFANEFADVGLRGLLEDATLDQEEVLAAALAVVSEQKRRITWLESLAMTDELTGLCNRRGFLTALSRELAACARDESLGGVLLLLDLDGFKLINDRYGHLAGDAYLRAVAMTLRSLVRPSDLIARLGGDEFAVLLSRTDVREGELLAKRLDLGLNRSTMEWGGRTLTLQASMGLADLHGKETAEELFARADAQLYAVKEVRKNKK